MVIASYIVVTLIGLALFMKAMYNKRFISHMDIFVSIQTLNAILTVKGGFMLCVRMKNILILKYPNHWESILIFIKLPCTFDLDSGTH